MKDGHAIAVCLPDDPDAPSSGTVMLEGAEVGLNLLPGEAMSNVALLDAAPALLGTWPVIAAAVRTEARLRLGELEFSVLASAAELRPWCVSLESRDDDPATPLAATWSFWADAEEDAYIDVTTLNGTVDDWELRSIEGG